MLSIQVSNKFEKTYKVTSELVRKQIKLVIKKLAINPSDKSLKTKLSDISEPKDKTYESFVNNSCKLIWTCDKNKCSILILDICTEKGTTDTLNKLYDLDKDIKARESRSKETKSKDIV
jgi:hypothetical protein